MKKTILFANADEGLANLYRRFFAEQGYRIETVSAAVDCVAQLRSAPPDILVIERELPWGGGDGVLALMRQDVTLPQVPVILLVADTPLDALPKLIAPPVVACLAKPFRLRSLVKMVGYAESLLSEREPAATVAGEMSQGDYPFCERQPWKSIFAR